MLTPAQGDLAPTPRIEPVPEIASFLAGDAELRHVSGRRSWRKQLRRRSRGRNERRPLACSFVLRALQILRGPLTPHASYLEQLRLGHIGISFATRRLRVCGPVSSSDPNGVAGTKGAPDRSEWLARLPMRGSAEGWRFVASAAGPASALRGYGASPCVPCGLRPCC